MRTVKELSQLTGISKRTLHYYDEIGLLKPTLTTEAGYRLYNEEALYRLQQILFFRELDFTLKDILTILKNPNYNKDSLLDKQKELLILKRNRLDGLINLIERIKKGEDILSFQEFSTEDIDEILKSMQNNMTAEQLGSLTEQYGGIKEWEQEFRETLNRSESKENLSKLTKWYGSKAAAKEAVKHPITEDSLPDYQAAASDLFQKIAACKSEGISSGSLNGLVNAYRNICKDLYHMESPDAMLKEMAKLYQTDDAIIQANDSLYGEGSSKFFGEALIYYLD